MGKLTRFSLKGFMLLNQVSYVLDSELQLYLATSRGVLFGKRLAAWGRAPYSTGN